MDQPKITVDFGAVDWDRVDEAALAIMLLGLHEGWRTWKGIDWDVLERLHEKGLITDPKSKAKSVIFTEEGLESAQRLFEILFGRTTGNPWVEAAPMPKDRRGPCPS